MKKLCLIGLVLMAIGCTGPNDPTTIAVNRQSLGTYGNVVGTLPDGREVRHYEISRGQAYHEHHIYVVDGVTTVTTNKERGGKGSYNLVESVIVDGVTFVPQDKK